VKILVCVKRVPAPGAKINVTGDGMDVDSAHLGFTTSPHEECGVEGAIQLKEEHGGEVTVLTLGGGEAEEQLRYAASVGADHGVLVKTDGAPWDPQRTAAAIAEAIGDLETDDPFDLILFGNESADAGGFQVGIRVAHALGRPIVQGIKGIDVGDGSVTARREIDGGFEVYELPRPCVLGVKEGLNLPRYPTMKGRLASKKLEIQTVDGNADAGGMARVRLRRPAEQVSETIILGEGPEAASAVVDVLEELGVL
jgi:electron transfer flavoprotein beta subunit